MIDKLKPLLGDIRFWIITFLLLRLIGITNPPLETAHNWRQTTVTMVARNFLEEDNNILYPRLDFAGEKTGITGMEFPILNYSIYLISEVFGYTHWYGRLINLLISSLGIFFFYRLVEKYLNEKTAFYASIVLLCSIWLPYSRKIMPDTFSVSFMMMGIYYASKFLEENKWGSLLLYFVFTLVAGLAKLPVLYLGSIYFLFLFQKDIKLINKLAFSLISGLLLLPIVWWYFSWVPYLVEKYEFWHFFMGKDILTGIQEIIKDFPLVIKIFYQSSIKFSGFAMFLFGLYWMFYSKQRLLKWLLLITFSFFVVVIFKAGWTFAHHAYYIIPFVPIMALIVGYGLAELKSKKIAVSLLCLIALEGVGGQFHDVIIRDRNAPMINLEKDLDRVCGRKDLILINSGKYPTPMYFAHRKGWVADNQEIQKPEYISELKTKGLKYIIILGFDKKIDLDYKVVFSSENYMIYQVD
ncbi:MAG: hypothetical protein GY827_00745 [Cytophagales bacterium]|nr:hypothetical protein [Cytophagales bacterium]